MDIVQSVTVENFVCYDVLWAFDEKDPIVGRYTEFATSSDNLAFIPIDVTILDIFNGLFYFFQVCSFDFVTCRFR